MIIGLITSGGDLYILSVLYSQSLSQISNIVVVPSKSQVTVHPQTGKRESIFVNLSVIYPTPEEAGTELSFEEIIAANRGWLNHNWDEEPSSTGSVLEQSPLPPPPQKERFVIHKDSDILDENGMVASQPKQPRGPKKKKVMEVNETQISELPNIKAERVSLLHGVYLSNDVFNSQSEARLTFRAENAQEERI